MLLVEENYLDSKSTLSISQILYTYRDYSSCGHGIGRRSNKEQHNCGEIYLQNEKR